jgi:hypothetical protein
VDRDEIANARDGAPHGGQDVVALAELDLGSAPLERRVAQAAVDLLGDARAEVVERDLAERRPLHLAPHVRRRGLEARA